jgi:RHS repeat-associated protein
MKYRKFRHYFQFKRLVMRLTEAITVSLMFSPGLISAQSTSCPVTVQFTMGDTSGTGSERYRLTLTPLTTNGATAVTFSNTAYTSEVFTEELMRGTRYAITMTWKDGTREPPDYDYVLASPLLLDSACAVVEDELGLFPGYWSANSSEPTGGTPDTFTGKTAYLTIGKLEGLDLVNYEVTLTPGSTQLVHAVWAPAGFSGPVAWEVVNETGSSVQFTANVTDNALSIAIEENSPGGELWIIAREDCGGEPGACGEHRQLVKVGCGGCGVCESGYTAHAELRSVAMEFPLGLTTRGRSAGSLLLRAESPTAEMAQPAGLLVNTFGEEVQTVYQSGVIRQVKSGDTLVDIIATNQYAYLIRYYTIDKVDDYNPSTGRWELNGTPSPDRTYRVENPDGAGGDDELLIIREPGSGGETAVRYVHNAGDWTLIRGITPGNSSGLAKETISNSVSGDERTETRTVLEVNNTVRSKTTTTYRTYTVDGQPLERKVKEVQDPDGDKLTTLLDYDADGRLVQTASLAGATSGDPTGDWTRWTYDGNGRIQTIHRPFVSASTNLTGNLRVTHYDYAEVDDDDDEHADYARRPRTVTESVIVGGATTTLARTYFAFMPDSGDGRIHVEERAATPGNAYGHGSNYTTIEYYHPDAFSGVTAGKLRQRLGFDGLTQSMLYQTGYLTATGAVSAWSFTPDAHGPDLREVTIHGITAATNGVAHRTTWDTRILDGLGRTRLEETFLYVGGANALTNLANRLSWTGYSLDALGRVEETHRSDGTTTIAAYACCGLEEQTGPDGRVTSYTYDAMQRRASETQEDYPYPGTNTVTTFAYDAVGRVTNTVVSADGLANSRSTSHDVAGRVLASVDELGRVTTTAYSVNALTNTVTTPLGAVYVTAYNPDGSLAQGPVDGSEAVHYHTYLVDSAVPGLVHKVVTGDSPSAPQWRKSYTNPLGQMFREEHNAPTNEDFRRQTTYNSLGRPVSVLNYYTNSGGSSWTMASRFRRYMIYDDLGEVTLQGHDYNGNGSITEASQDRITGHEVEYVWLGSAWWLERKTYFYPEWNSNTRVLLSTHRVRQTGLGASNLVAQEVRIDRYDVPTTTRTYVYPNLQKTVVTTDVPGSDVAAEQTHEHGLLRTTRDSYGLLTSHAYDALARRIQTSDPRAGTNTWAYAENGLLESHTDVFGKETEYTYDANGQRTRTTDPLGKETRHDYDDFGRVTHIWGDATYPTMMEYDLFGRLHKLHTYRTGSGFSGGAWPSVGAGDLTTWTYSDATGLLTSKTDATTNSVSYTYDRFGSLKTRTWAREKAGGGALTTTYTIWNTGDLGEINYNDGTPGIYFQFYRDGSPWTVTDEFGVRAFVRSSTYYDDYRESFNPAGGGLYSYVYFQVNRQTGSLSATNVPGRVRGFQSNNGSNNVWTFDNKGRFASIGSSSGFINHQFAYETDTPVLASVTSREYGNTRLTRTFTRGPGYRVTQVANAAANGTLTYGYPDHDDVGRRLKMTLSDTTSAALDHGSHWAYTYNDRGELASGKKKNASNAHFPGLANEYDYDHLGNRTEWRTSGDSSGANLRATGYTANALNQYTEVDPVDPYDIMGDVTPTGSVVTVDGFATDRRDSWFRREINAANGSSAVYATNWVQVVNGGVTTTAQVVSFIPEEPEEREYDADGNLTRDGRWVYTWTAENRLRKMETRDDLPADVPDLTLEFKYDYLGRRIQKVVKVGGTTTLDRRYVWQGWRMIEEVNSAGAVQVGYEWGPDLSQTLEGAGTVGGLLRITDVSGGGAWESWMSFPCYDANGNVMGLVGYATGNILCQYEYDPYGRLLRTTGNASLAASNPFLFSTKFLDRETGLSYYGYRYYDAGLGRWVSRDPIEEEGGVHLYAFNDGDPVNQYDVLGLKSKNGVNLSDDECLCVCPVKIVGKLTDTFIENPRSLRQNGELGRYAGHEFTVTVHLDPIKAEKKKVGEHVKSDFYKPTLEWNERSNERMWNRRVNQWSDSAKVKGVEDGTLKPWFKDYKITDKVVRIVDVPSIEVKPTTRHKYLDIRVVVKPHPVCDKFCTQKTPGPFLLKATQQLVRVAGVFDKNRTWFKVGENSQGQVE